LRLRDETLLERNDCQSIAREVQQFPRLQQEGRIGRAAIARVAGGKCLVQHNTVVGQRGEQMRK